MQMNEQVYLAAREALFLRWKQHSGTVVPKGKEKAPIAIDHRTDIFVKDGVVCPAVWYAQEVRPLFLLKEAYGGTADWDLIEDQLTAPSPMTSKMWQRVANWTHGLFRTTDRELPSFSLYEAGTYAENEDLKKIAVVNVKKSGGTSASDWDTVRAYAEFDRDFLREQIALCDPTVIICGYTGSAMDAIYGPALRRPCRKDGIYPMELNGHEVSVLDFWHPANQFPDILNYYGLLGTYRAALQTQRRNI